MARAYLGLGSNLGDRRAMLDQAVEALDWGEVRVVARSPIYETEPVGGPPGQPWFLNMVIGVDTTLSPGALWDRCAAAEIALGRTRAHEPRWGPRTIDVDVLLYGDVVLDTPELTLPHPRMHERAFVLVPLLDLNPSISIPGKGSARAALDAVATSQNLRPYASS